MGLIQLLRRALGGEGEIRFEVRDTRGNLHRGRMPYQGSLGSATEHELLADIAALAKRRGIDLQAVRIVGADGTTADIPQWSREWHQPKRQS